MTPKNNNSPNTSKASTPPPADVKLEPVETNGDSKAIKIETVESVQSESLSTSTNGKVETPATTKSTRRKTVASSNKKSATQKPAAVSTPTVDKPEKKSKRLSAKFAATPKIKAVVIPNTPERVKTAVPAVATPKKKNQVVNFVPGSSIEAQNFDGKWIPVKVVEVDMEEREVLVRSCDKNKSKTG